MQSAEDPAGTERAQRVGLLGVSRSHGTQRRDPRVRRFFLGRLGGFPSGMVRIARRPRFPRPGAHRPRKRIRRQPPVRSQGPARLSPAEVLDRSAAGRGRRSRRRRNRPQPPRGRGVTASPRPDRPFRRSAPVAQKRAGRRDGLARQPARVRSLRRTAGQLERHRGPPGKRTGDRVAEAIFLVRYGHRDVSRPFAASSLARRPRDRPQPVGLPLGRGELRDR